MTDARARLSGAWRARLRQTAPRFLLALALGAAGGAIFATLRLPLPWMLGAMTAVTISAVAGAPVAVFPPVRSAMVAVLGVLLGSQFTIDLFDQITQWYVGLTGVVASVAVAAIVCMVYFRKIGGFDRTTAYFASMPGGLAEMMIVGEAFGGDGRKISLTHGLRIFVAVFLIAFYYRIFEGYAPTTLPIAPASTLDWQDILILIGCAVVGLPGARALRIPAAQLVGPMVVSAAVHLAGVVDAKPPLEVVAAAQVILGAAIGARFAGVPVGQVWRTALLAVGAAVIMVLIAAGFAFALGALSGMRGTALFLAFAPGGLAEMSIIALSFGTAAAFVATHHIVRIILLVIVAPQLFRLIRTR